MEQIYKEIYIEPNIYSHQNNSSGDGAQRNPLIVRVECLAFQYF